MILQRTLDTYAGFYDFKVTGGAVGSYDLQVPVPINTIAMEFVIVTIVSPTSGGGGMSTISWDMIVTTVIPNFTVVGQFKVAGPYTNFVGAYTVNLGVYPGNGVEAPFSGGSAVGFSIGMSIGTDPLTDGSFQFYLRAISADF